MKRYFLVLVLPFLLTGALAQSISKELDQYIENARKTYNVPGLSVAVVKDGKIVHNQGYGVIEMGSEEKVDGNTLYAIASNSKAFVSSALGVLVAEGKINWNDKVTDYLPYFKIYGVYESNNATIADLLCHRAGLGTYSGDAIWYKSELSAEEVIRRIQFVPQAYEFRNGYGYSNLMFITAGEVIRKVTGKSWAEFVKERFFDPLGMKRTVTSTNDLANMENVATPHKSVINENIAIEWTNWDNMGAAGGIISSTGDMAKWMILQLNKGINGSDTLLAPSQQNILWTLHNNYTLSENGKKRIPGRHFTGYGLGWGLQDYYGRMMVSHGGGYDGMYSRVVMVPDEDLGIVVLTNSMTGISTPLAYHIVNFFIKEDSRDWIKYFYNPQRPDSRIVKLKEAQKKGTKPSLNIKEYSGTYTADMYGELNIEKKGNELRLTFEHSPLLSATLRHWHDDVFEIVWDNEHAWFGFGLVTFKLMDGKTTGMDFNVPNYDIFFHEFDVRKR